MVTWPFPKGDCHKQAWLYFVTATTNSLFLGDSIIQTFFLYIIILSCYFLKMMNLPKKNPRPLRAERKLEEAKKMTVKVKIGRKMFARGSTLLDLVRLTV